MKKNNQTPSWSSPKGDSRACYCKVKNAKLNSKIVK